MYHLKMPTAQWAKMQTFMPLYLTQVSKRLHCLQLGYCISESAVTILFKRLIKTQPSLLKIRLNSIIIM